MRYLEQSNSQRQEFRVGARGKQGEQGVVSWGQGFSWERSKSSRNGWLGWLYNDVKCTYHHLTIHLKIIKTVNNMLCRFSKEQACFNFMAAITIRSDFRAQENKICHCFHFFPFYLP